MDSVVLENVEHWLGLRHLFIVNQLLDSWASFFKKETVNFLLVQKKKNNFGYEPPPFYPFPV
jgi:hypothetical protein